MKPVLLLELFAVVAISVLQQVDSGFESLAFLVGVSILAPMHAWVISNFLSQ